MVGECGGIESGGVVAEDGESNDESDFRQLKEKPRTASYVSEYGREQSVKGS